MNPYNNGNPLIDFERTAQYTRSREQKPQSQYYQQGNELSRGYQRDWVDNFRLPDNRSFTQNKKEGRNELQDRFSHYSPMPCAQAYPVYQLNDNNFFFNNVPQNTRLNEYNSGYKF